jgi:23S rRNA (cytosine1962-C5)-methyltransferase
MTDKTARARPSRRDDDAASSWSSTNAFRQPWVRLKYATSHNPCVFSSMVHDASPEADVGDLVHIYTKRGEYFGRGLYDPLAKMPLRVYHHHHHQHEAEDFDEAGLVQLIHGAIDLRTKVCIQN